MNNDLKNILITGGAGFIGSHLALKLKTRGYEVTVLDNLSPQIHGENPEQDSPLYQSIAGEVRFIKGDVTNRKDVEKAIAHQDAIIHLAAETGTGQSMYEIDRYSRVNTSGTALILDVLVNHQNTVRQFILASSRAVYGEGKYRNSRSEIVFPKQRSPRNMKEGVFEMTDAAGEILQPLPTDENSKLHPTSFYGITKLQQEQMVQLVCDSVGINFVILRYQNVYGAGQSLVNPYTGILSIFSSQILAGKSINVFEDGLPTRDFINIEDTVEATVRSLEMETARQKIINVGTGVANTVFSVAKLLIQKYNKDVFLNVSGDFRVGDIRHNFADLSVMKSVLGFTPAVTFDQGIAQFTQWVLQQPLRDNHFSRSLEEMKAKGFMKS